MQEGLLVHTAEFDKEEGQQVHTAEFYFIYLSTQGGLKPVDCFHHQRVIPPGFF
jgi:hypothetical protein